MVHFTQSLMPDIPLATSLPTTFTFQPNNNQIDEQSTLQQQSIPSSSLSQLTSSNQQQRLISNDESNNTNHQIHPNDYETRLRCPNCDTWVVNLSDHLRKTHRIASPVDRKPLLRMARLEKRRMTESVNNPSSTTTTTTTITNLPSTNNRQASSTLLVNGLPPSHSTNEIENLLFKHEQDASPQYSVTLPENILLNHSMTHFTSPTSNKRQRHPDEHTEQLINGPLLSSSSIKKSRLELIDGTKLPPPTTHSSSGKSSKKNRNKSQQQQQQQQPQLQTIIKTSASGIFPQQTVTIQQHMEESSDDLSKVLQMMGNEMNFLNQHLQTTSLLLQKQLDLARDSLHACSVQFAHLKRMIQQQI